MRALGDIVKQDHTRIVSATTADKKRQKLLSEEERKTVRLATLDDLITRVINAYGVGDLAFSDP